MNQNSTQPNYWIARMTISGQKTWKNTWQWQEAIKNNVYLTEYDYDEITPETFYKIEEFLNKVKDIKVGDVLLLTYHSVIYAYGEVDNPPKSNQITTTKKTIAEEGNRDDKHGVFTYEDAEAFYEDLDYFPECRRPFNDDKRQRWRQQIKVKSWNFFENSKVTTEGIKKAKEEMGDYDSIYSPLHHIPEKFAKEKIEKLGKYRKNDDMGQNINDKHINFYTYKNTVHLDDTVDLSTPIYKYMSLSHLVEMAFNEELRICKVKSWEDPYENFYLKDNLMYKGCWPISSGRITDGIYGQSWTLSEESNAMWEIYSQDHDGIKIKTSVQKLCDALVPRRTVDLMSFIGKIGYKTENDIHDLESVWNGVNFLDSTIPVLKSLFSKRNSFTYENEIRVIVFCSSGSPLTYCDSIKFNINPNDFIDEICLNPRINDKEKCRTEKVLCDLGINYEKIKKSNLYNFQPHEIIVL